MADRVRAHLGTVQRLEVWVDGDRVSVLWPFASAPRSVLTPTGAVGVASLLREGSAFLSGGVTCVRGIVGESSGLRVEVDGLAASPVVELQHVGVAFMRLEPVKARGLAGLLETTNPTV